MISKEVRAHLFAILAITIWGTTFISTKVLLTDFTPTELFVFRFVIGYVVLLCLYPKKMDRNKIKDELGLKSRCMPFEQEHIDDKCVCCGKPAKTMVYWGKAY